MRLGKLKKILDKNFIKKVFKYLTLLIIVSICFNFIDSKKDGFDFGVIALICWAFTFLDLARIKIKDFEIDLMSRKEVLTADEKKEFLKCYELLQQFMKHFLRKGYVNDDALGCIWQARDQARLFLPKKLEDYVEDYLQKAIKTHRAFILWEDNQDPEKTKNLSDERHKYETYFYDMNIADTFKHYLKVKTDAE